MWTQDLYGRIEQLLGAGHRFATGARVCFTYLPTTRAFDISVNQYANISAVPEPATLWFACLGLPAAGIVQRRKRG